MKVSIAGIQYDCTSAIKGADYVLLYDDTTLIASFYGVTNFDSFVLEGGEWSYPYVTLTAAGWQSGDNGYYTQTVTFPGVTESNGVLIAPRVMRPDDLEAFEGVYIDDSGRGVNSLTFKAHDAKPTIDLDFNVDILKEGATGIFYTGNGGGSGKVQEALDAHTADRNNPHGVTPEQIGAATMADLTAQMSGIGNLHVWKRTRVVSEEVPEVPAGYTLGEVTTGKFQVSSYSSENSDSVRGIAKYYVWDTLKLKPDGSPDTSAATLTSIRGGQTDDANKLLEKFILFKEITGYRCDVDEILKSPNVQHIPPDAVFTYSRNDYENNDANMYRTFVDKVQEVSTRPAIPAIPAGTHVDYLTSTNRDAYQEGNNEQPPGYTLGEPKQTNLHYHSNSDTYYYVGHVAVSENGTVTLERETTLYLKATNMEQSRDVMAGKFVQDQSVYGKPILFIPSDAQFFVSGTGGKGVDTDKAQTVTGHPAIPPNTTIEYFGQLGESTRLLSYVGTGTYGVGAPNVLAFDFSPKAIIITPVEHGAIAGAVYGGIPWVNGISSGVSELYLDHYTSEKVNITWGEKSISWHSTKNSDIQLNHAGIKYLCIAIG